MPGLSELSTGLTAFVSTGFAKKVPRQALRFPSHEVRFHIGHRPVTKGENMQSAGKGANFTRRQMADELGINVRTLDNRHRLDPDGAPPRFRASPRIWIYPVEEYRRWRAEQLAKEKMQATMK